MILEITYKDLLDKVGKDWMNKFFPIGTRAVYTLGDTVIKLK